MSMVRSLFRNIVKTLSLRGSVEYQLSIKLPRLKSTLRIVVGVVIIFAINPRINIVQIRVFNIVHALILLAGGNSCSYVSIVPQWPSLSSPFKKINRQTSDPQSERHNNKRDKFLVHDFVSFLHILSAIGVTRLVNLIV